MAGRLPIAVARAFAALPESDSETLDLSAHLGDTSPGWKKDSVEELTLVFQAQRGAVGSKVRIGPRWLFGEDAEAEETSLGTPIEAAGELVAPLRAAPVTIEFQDDAEIWRHLGLRIPRGATGLELDLEDVGTPATPASVAVHITGGF